MCPSLLFRLLDDLPPCVKWVNAVTIAKGLRQFTWTFNTEECSWFPTDPASLARPLLSRSCCQAYHGPDRNTKNCLARKARSVRTWLLELLSLSSYQAFHGPDRDRILPREESSFSQDLVI